MLTAEILRVVNSAFFGAKREVKTAVQAVTLLGNRALRNLALCLAVRDAVRPGAIPKFDLMSYWEDALRRGVAARLIARRVGFDGDEAFTLGLLTDFGVLALFFVRPDLAPQWPEWRKMGPDERREAEQRSAGLTHDAIGLQLARAWNLPAGIALPMACHHTPEAPVVPVHHREACRIAQAADYVASIYGSEDATAALARSRRVLGQLFGLKPEDADAIFEAIPAAVEEAAQSLGLRVAAQPRFEEILRAANQCLVAANNDYETLTQRLEQALEEKRALMRKLEEANRKLEQIAFIDPLTELLNRRRFQEVSSGEIQRHSRSGQWLTLVMIDLDHFKRVNDTFGHATGDEVLVAVARVMRETLRQTEITARLGGEELCCVLPETDEPGARVAVERLRMAIEAIDIRTPAGKVPVTASLGVVTWRGRALTQPAVEATLKLLLDTSDQGLYESKRSGRNRATHMTVNS